MSREIPFESISQQDDVLYELLESETLKLCPFCGSDDIKTSIHLKGVEVSQPYHLYSIFCCSCNVANSMDDPKSLIDWWNSRA
ncbi:Lar family restriction alleviation protein [Leptolyngbya sp. FACHB-541]|nr:Lar family restriction alleviation protein [Leptolyngbya sp. FACHB-541]